MEILLIVQHKLVPENVEYWAIPADLGLYYEGAVEKFFEQGLCLPEWQIKDLDNVDICRVVHYLRG